MQQAMTSNGYPTHIRTFIKRTAEHLLDPDGDLRTVNLMLAEYADHAAAAAVARVGALLRQVLGTVNHLHVAPAKRTQSTTCM